MCLVWLRRGVVGQTAERNRDSVRKCIMQHPAYHIPISLSLDSVNDGVPSVCVGVLPAMLWAGVQFTPDRTVEPPRADEKPLELLVTLLTESVFKFTCETLNMKESWCQLQGSSIKCHSDHIPDNFSFFRDVDNRLFIAGGSLDHYRP